MLAVVLRVQPSTKDIKKTLKPEDPLIVFVSETGQLKHLLSDYMDTYSLSLIEKKYLELEQEGKSSNKNLNRSKSIEGELIFDKIGYKLEVIDSTSRKRKNKKDILAFRDQYKHGLINTTIFLRFICKILFWNTLVLILIESNILRMAIFHITSIVISSDIYLYKKYNI